MPRVGDGAVAEKCLPGDEPWGIGILEGGVEQDQQGAGAEEEVPIGAREDRRTIVGFLEVLAGKPVRVGRRKSRGEEVAARTKRWRKRRSRGSRSGKGAHGAKVAGVAA